VQKQKLTSFFNSGLWVAFPAYMTIVFGTDIIQGLDMAAESASSKKRN